MTGWTALRLEIRAIAALACVVGLVLVGVALRPTLARAATPQALPGYATVAVSVVGDRSGPSTMAPLARARFGLFTDQPTDHDAFTGYVTAHPLMECESEADGYCVFRVPIGGDNGYRAGQRLWIAPIAGPPGKPEPEWFASHVWETAPLAATNRFQLTHVFQTPALQDGGLYVSGQAGFMGDPGIQTTPPNTTISSGTMTFAQRISSAGVFPLSRVDPELHDVCGQNVAMVVDLSTSMNNSVPQLKTALDAFVDALHGTPSRAALYTFSTNSPAVRVIGGNSPLISVATTRDAQAFRNLYRGWSNATADGYTNWDQALSVVAAANQAAGPADRFDLVVFLTDGLPTTFGTGGVPSGSGLTRFREMENAVASANLLKQTGGRVLNNRRYDGTRVLAVGVGAGLGAGSEPNLSAISGLTEYADGNIREADFFRTSNFGEVGRLLRSLFLSECAPSVSVIKQIVPHGEGIDQAYTPSTSWHFTAQTITEGATVEPASAYTSPATGGLNFDLELTAEHAPAGVRITEDPQSELGYTPYSVDGRNAVCVNKSADNAPVDVTDVGTTGFEVDVGVEDAVSCTVYNQAPDVRSASIVVHKRWRVTTAAGTTTYVEGEQPEGLESELSLTGPGSEGAGRQQWSVQRNGYRKGDHVTLSDAVRLGLPGCTFERGDVTRTLTRGRTMQVTALERRDTSDTVTLRAGLNAYTITSDVACHSHLILRKQVVGGNAAPDEWTLQAFGPGGALHGPHGTSGVRAEVTSGAIYQLGEAANGSHLANYVQIDDRPRPITHPRSTGSMACEIYTGGQARPGDSAGEDGGVVVPLGQTMQCTATNVTAPLTLIKKVDGGSAVPSDFKVDVTASGSNPFDLPVQTVTGHGPPGTTIYVRPGQTYQLSEPTQAHGYKLAHILCTVGTRSAYGDTIEIPAGASATCTLTNYIGARPPKPPPPAQPAAPPPTPEVKPHLYPATVAITKSVDASSAASGNTLTYTIDVQTTSRAPAISIKVCDRLPAPLIPVSAPHGQISAGEVCWTVQKLPFGGHRSFTVTASVPHLSGATTATNVAHLSGANIPSRIATAAVQLIPTPLAPPFTG